MDKVKYSFQVKGVYPSGTKAKMSGTLWAADGYPFSAFDEAVTVCQAMTPGLVVDRTRPNQVTLRKLKSRKGVRSG